MTEYAASLLTVVLLFASPAQGQSVKAKVVSSPLKPVGLTEWVRDLGYVEAEIYPLALNSLGCPFIEAGVAGTKLSLMLDTGTARGILVTDHAPAFAHRVERRTEELNADGTPRGESFGIRLDALTVLGQTFGDVAGTQAAWRMFSSVPFDGTVGLDFFLDRRLSLDYHSGKVAAAASALPGKLDPTRYLVLDLVQPPESQGHILYARARVNGREAIVYLDTGYNVSFIDPAFGEGLTRVERSGRFKTFREQVPFEFGGQAILLDDLRESPISRGLGFDRPVAATLGSDVLSHFVMTIDLRARRLVLARAQ